jgi:serine/threonine protein kinase
MVCIIVPSLCLFVGSLPSFQNIAPPPKTAVAVVEDSKQKRLASIANLIEEKRWKEVAHSVKEGTWKDNLTIEDLEPLASQYPNSPFSNAVLGTKNILSLNEKTGLGLYTLFPIAIFAETSLADEVLKGKHFFQESLFGRELQYDPETKRFFIHLGTKGVKPIGEGRKKIVTKTVLYDRLHPAVMARGVAACDIRKEMDAMRALKGLPGLVEAQALMTHKDPKRKKHLMTVVTPIYRPGSLQGVIDNESLRLSLTERLKIALDIVTGLDSMHSKKYVHRDLGARNYLVNIEKTKNGKRTISAVIADMGRTILAKHAKGLPVQGNSGYLAPEGFFRSNMKGKDYYKTDLFAIGVVLWQLYYGKLPHWSRAHMYKRESLSLRDRYIKNLYMLQEERSPMVAYLSRKTIKKLHFSRRDKFLQVVIQLTDPNPAKRGTAATAKAALSAILNPKK